VRAKTKPKAALAMPDDFAGALDRSPAAAKHFNAFSPSAQREYLEWITEAKRVETRVSRITTAVEWIGEGKVRNWKYLKC
jgi:uncharacterized protein YdeI (YjbR/CyaY-like superfamily)